MNQTVLNPFKPGAGHMPPYLAGRDAEIKAFEELIKQRVILENLVLTGLRGVGKTVLLDTFKPLALKKEWLWVGTDLSESASLKEETMALRFITDLSVVTSNITIGQHTKSSIGFLPTASTIDQKLNYQTLIHVFQNSPGLVSDKLKTILELVWRCLENKKISGIIFSYDEAQTMSDHPDKEQYPLALLLDVFQSIQKKNIPFMLVLTGLPTLFPKLVEARTYAERMFRVMFLNKLNAEESRKAIIKPLEENKETRISFNEETIAVIIKESGGYPFFIQFICKETFESFIQTIHAHIQFKVPITEIIEKLDRDFFAGRWARTTDRQRQLLCVIATLENCNDEFTVQDVVMRSKDRLRNCFSSSHVNQMFLSLTNAGLIYKNRHGKYSFAVPLLDRFIVRQFNDNPSLLDH